MVKRRESPGADHVRRRDRDLRYRHGLRLVQLEQSHEPHLGGGALPDQAPGNTGIAAMCEVSDPVLEERRLEVFVDGRAIGEVGLEQIPRRVGRVRATGQRRAVTGAGGGGRPRYIRRWIQSRSNRRNPGPAIGLVGVPTSWNRHAISLRP